MGQCARCRGQRFVPGKHGGRARPQRLSKKKGPLLAVGLPCAGPAAVRGIDEWGVAGTGCTTILKAATSPNSRRGGVSRRRGREAGIGDFCDCGTGMGWRYVGWDGTGWDGMGVGDEHGGEGITMGIGANNTSRINRQRETHARDMPTQIKSTAQQSALMSSVLSFQLDKGPAGGSTAIKSGLISQAPSALWQREAVVACAISIRR